VNWTPLSCRERLPDGEGVLLDPVRDERPVRSRSLTVV
jgi:hypothetical protein